MGLAGCTFGVITVMAVFALAELFELTEPAPAELPPRLNELGDEAEEEVPERLGLATCCA